MKRIVVFLLCFSLGVNAWLLWRRVARDGVRTVSPLPAPSARSVAAKTAPELPIASIESADPAALSEVLRVAGADDSALRAMSEGLLRRRYREKLAVLRIERARSAWWRAGRTVLESDAALVQEMVTAPLERALGRDPQHVIDAEGRYSFLPEEKRRRLAQIDLDYADLMARVPPSSSSVQTPTEAAELRLLADERRKDVLTTLTPEERAEYDLRFSGTAGTVSQRAVLMAVTEAEYRALKPLIDDFDAKSKALPRGDTFVAAYEEVQRASAQQLVAKLGYERALEYIWSGYVTNYIPLRRAVDDGQIPAETPGRVMELAAETGRKAAGVHVDPALTLEQRRAALVALQQISRAQLDALLPAEVQRAQPVTAFRWLSDLSAGRYSVVQPSLLSSGGFYGGSIAAPAPPRIDAPSMPVRPAGK